MLYELTHPKKRYAGLSRFCHHAEDLLAKDKILSSGSNLFRQEAVLRILAEHDTGACRMLSPDPCLDGRTVSLGCAVELSEACADAVIFLFSHFAIVQDEVSKKGRNRFLLSSHNRRND